MVSELGFMGRNLISNTTFTRKDTLLFGTLEAPSSPMVPQALSEIVDPHLRRSTHVYKSTKLPDFA